MALSPHSANTIGIVVNDYTGTPKTFTMPALVVGSVIPLLTVDRDKQQLFINSSTGGSSYGTFDHGITASTQMDIKFVLQNTSASTTASAFTLCMGLFNNNLDATAFPSWVTTHPVTTGGVPTVKWIFSVPDKAGNACTVTIPASVFAIKPLEVEAGVLVMPVTLNVEAAITIS